MKRINFYKKLGMSFAIAIGTNFAATAQNASTFYKIDNVHNGDGGMGSISVLNLIVQKGSKLSLNLMQKPDSVFWMHYELANPQTQYNSNDTIIVLKRSEVARVYVSFNKQWYTQKDIYYVIEDTVNCIKHDLKGTGNLVAPIKTNGHYTWYFKDTLIANNNTHTLYPKEKGKYKVEIKWEESANLRVEEIKTVTYEFEVTQLPVPLGFEKSNIVNEINSVYPNPASEVAFINAKGTFEFSIETANTELISSGSGNDLVQLDLRGMNAGIYFIRIKSNEKQSVRRLVVR